MIIKHHPVEFLTKSLPVALSSLSQFTYEGVALSPLLTQVHDGSQVDPNGPFGGLMVQLKSWSITLYDWSKFFPNMYMYLAFSTVLATYSGITLCTDDGHHHAFGALWTRPHNP